MQLGTSAPITSRTCRSVLRVMVVMVVVYLPCILRILYVLLQRCECLLGFCQITRLEGSYHILKILLLLFPVTLHNVLIRITAWWNSTYSWHTPSLWVFIERQFFPAFLYQNVQVLPIHWLIQTIAAAYIHYIWRLHFLFRPVSFIGFCPGTLVIINSMIYKICPVMDCQIKLYSSDGHLN